MLFKRLPIVLIVITSLVFGSARADDKDERYLEVLREGVVYAQTQKWELAAMYWSDVTTDFEEKDKHSTSEIGLLYILQVISFEKANDARAYAAWTDAIGLFLEGGTSWDLYKQSLAEDIEQLDFQISSSFSSDGVQVNGTTQKALILQSLDNLLQLTRYDGPKPGLLKRVVEEVSEVTVARNYFPRSSVALAQGGGADDARSRIALDDFDLESTDEATTISRGIIAEPPLTSPDEASEKLASNIAAEGDGLAMENPPIASPSISVVETTLASLDRDEFSSRRDSPIISRRIADTGTSLTPEEKEMAKTAWRYFSSNRQANTGFFNSVHNYPYTTMWDLGSSIAALHCAHALAVIDDKTFNEYLTVFLNTLADIPLYDDVLPNREYDTRSGLMTNLRNKVDDKGSGYSALDLGRLLTWMAVIKEEHAQHGETIDDIVGRWDLSRILEGDEFHRELLISGKLDRKQEGRFGYEQYAALAFRYWGYDVANAFDIAEVEFIEVEDIQIMRDTRDPDFLNLEPFLMVMLEFSSFPSDISQQLDGLLGAHKLRDERSGELALFSEDSIDREPWFLYNIISAEEGDWICKDSRGRVAEGCQVVSTKAAFAASVLFDMEFLDRTLESVTDKFDQRFGFYAGIYEDGSVNKALTSNTNALILESLASKVRGTAFIDPAYDEQLQLSRSRLAN